MKILAFEFSSAQRSVALHDTGTANLVEIMHEGEGPVPAFSMVTEILEKTGTKKDELECLALGLGPGSYTGIRIALSIARGWQAAAPISLVGVGSMVNMAHVLLKKGGKGLVTLVVDAHGGEYYQSSFLLSEGAVKEVQAARLISKVEFNGLEESDMAVFGPGLSRTFPWVQPVFPAGNVLAELAVNPALHLELEPIYLRETKFVKAPPPRIIA